MTSITSQNAHAALSSLAAALLSTPLECESIVDTSPIVFDTNKIYHTRGVYASLDYKNNGVKGEHLKNHIKYNLVMRPGRALFVEGVCLNQGYLSAEQCQEQAQKLEGVTATKDTAPYH